MNKLLIIQTAFIGDVILATALIEQLNHSLPEVKVDMLVRKGNEVLLKGHPKLNEVLIWDKKNGKYATLLKVARHVRRNNYDAVVNLQRFASSGFVTAFSGAAQKIGFDKNPMSFLFTTKVKHEMDGEHEVDRNLKLLSGLGLNGNMKPKLYPSQEAMKKVEKWQDKPFVCLAPSSVWYTKQWPAEKWVELIKLIQGKTIFLLGAPDDFEYCEEIKTASGVESVINLAGKINLLESAALMSKSSMNYVNDSAPMHLSSAMNAPVTAIYCSTVPRFGFGPLSDTSRVVETDLNLDCRPCGLHGFKTCPEGHFNCAKSINVNKVLAG